MTVTAPLHATIDTAEELLRHQVVALDPPKLDGMVQAAITGDRRAREQLLAEFHPLVLRYCRARLGTQETVLGSADDVAQEVCLAIVDALPGYAPRRRPFPAFVYGIAAHKVDEVLRAIGRNRAEPVDTLPDTPAADDGPEHHLLRLEVTEQLRTALDVLPPPQREVLVLRISMGLSTEETAEAVGSTPGAVRVAQHAALRRLRRTVVPDEPAEPPRGPRAAYAALVEDLGATVLDVDAGLAAATGSARYSALVADVATALDLDAGLAAIIGTARDKSDG